jgi:hypothetical protein
VSSLPTFIIIGAMKAGTTSLFRYLGTHPDVAISKKKETNFFLGRREYERGLDWYREQFDGAKPARGEASPNYTKRHMWVGVAKRIVTTVPDVRLLFVARGPIARIQSHYVHNVSHGRETRPFSQAIAEDKRYVQTSRYAYQLEPFREHFDRDRILFVDSDDLRDDTLTTMKTAFDFIGVRADHVMDEADIQYHRSADKTRPSILERRVTNKRTRKLLRPLLPARVTGRPPIRWPEPTPADVDLLTRELRDDVAQFRTLTGMPFAQWPL